MDGSTQNPQVGGEQPQVDYVPWDDDEDARFERAMEEMDRKIFESLAAKVEAEGGDVSMELEDKQNGVVQESIEFDKLSPLQKQILESWNDYP
jgi:hypothetical protein